MTYLDEHVAPAPGLEVGDPVEGEGVEVQGARVYPDDARQKTRKILHISGKEDSLVQQNNSFVISI